MDARSHAVAFGITTQQNEMLVFRRSTPTVALTGRRGEAGIGQLSPAQHSRLTKALAGIKISDPARPGKTIKPFGGNTAVARGGSSRLTASTVYLVEHNGWTP